MDNDDTPEGWTESEYKEFKVDDGSDSDSDSDSYSNSDSDSYSYGDCHMKIAGVSSC